MLFRSYTELFPDATENTDLTDEINKTFSLFFRKFNYKISDVIVGTANHSATVSVKLTTIDSKVLARDFKAELLRTQITESAQAQKGNIKDSSRSLEAHYLILNHLLNTNDYDTAETDCNIQLVNTGNDKKEKWKIQRTNSLEDDLVGGLIADLAEEMYFYRIKKYIGAYAAALGGVDIVVFTGDRKSTRLNSSHTDSSRMPSSA